MQVSLQAFLRRGVDVASLRQTSLMRSLAINTGAGLKGYGSARSAATDLIDSGIVPVVGTQCCALRNSEASRTVQGLGCVLLRMNWQSSEKSPPCITARRGGCVINKFR